MTFFFSESSNVYTESQRWTTYGSRRLTHVTPQYLQFITNNHKHWVCTTGQTQDSSITLIHLTQSSAGLRAHSCADCRTLRQWQSSQNLTHFPLLFSRHFKLSDLCLQIPSPRDTSWMKHILSFKMCFLLSAWTISWILLPGAAVVPVRIQTFLYNVGL